VSTAEATKADLAEVRCSIRESARAVEERHLADLERADAGPQRMAVPERLVKRRTFWGTTEYRSTQAADYDWFYGLAKAEQARLRENWFSSSPDAQSPDEVFARIDQRDWLEQTRVVDASRALASGRIGDYKPARYGGLNPNHLIEGAPYDVRALWGNEDQARRHLAKAQRQGGMGRDWRERFWGHEPDRSRCQFFTDERGVVHPVRATCPPEEEPQREYKPWELEEF
jgi:hypothetical protein